ncbi:MAG: alpha/beta hydrolase, partial [Rikenellaceae bacterium]
MLKQFISCSLAMATIFSVSAQQKQKTGDVVAYFGQERVEKVDEGIVAYNFADGYFLPKTAMSGYIFQMGDALAWETFTSNFKNPYSGNLEAVNYGEKDDDVQWTPIKSDETGRFRDRKLRNAYLYSEYTAEKSEIMLLQATGGTRTIVNGMPHEGDHYDFGYTLIPFKTNKGVNQFIFTPGRFGYVEAKVIKPSQPVMFTKRDMTLADIIIGEDDQKWSAIRVVNASEKGVKDLSIRCELESGESATYATESIIDMTV